MKGSDARKVLPADLLWRRAVASQEWLAEKLVMKSAANVSQQIRRLERKKALAAVPEAKRLFLDKTDAPNTESPIYLSSRCTPFYEHEVTVP